MDTCIASSISHRTAYILKTLGHMEESRSKLSKTEYGTYEGWKYGRPLCDPSTSTVGLGASSIDQASSNGSKGNPSGVKGHSTKVNVRSKPSKTGPGSEKRGNSQNHLPTTEGSGGGVGGAVRIIPNNLPHYDTFYSPKTFQPLTMFNLFPNTPNSGDFRTGDGKIFSDTSSCYSNSSSSGITSLSTNYNNYSHEFSTATSCSGRQQIRRDIHSARESDKSSDVSGQSAAVKKKSTAALKCKSTIAHQEKKGRGGALVKKSVSENPDLNNNFYKGGTGIFFDNRKRMPGCNFFEMSGADRISQLAQPKQYPCNRHHCGDNCGKRKISAGTMQRINALAQPKLCHYTVCSCCLSPNCLGECSTRVNVNRTNAIGAADVDWDRLATPRKNYPPTFKEAYKVKSSALKAHVNKRIEKLSVPRKIINSGDYYLWLWNKKPDVHTFLKPIRRLSISMCDLKDTRVLLRCDLDFTKGKPIDCKVRDALPTMQLALKKGAKSIVIISKCGPDGVPKDPTFSLKPLAQVFEQYLETRVVFLDDCVGFQAQALCEDPVPGSVFLLENLSFHTEELGYVIDNDEKTVSTKEEIARFQKIISDHGDIYITDSFTELVHMTSTTVGNPPKEFGYGFNIKKELSIFNKFAVKPPIPVLAIVAGPFEKTWKVVRNLMGQVTDILVGGHLASVFVRAIKGIELGSTSCTDKMEKKALKLFSRAKDTKTTLHLPSDVVVRNVDTGEYFVTLTRDDIDTWFEIVDIGPHTRKCYTQAIREAAAILWLGDFGVLSDGTETIKTTYLEAAANGTPTYAADDKVKNFVSVISKPEECLFVTGDGETTEQLLQGQIPKGLAVLSKSRRKQKREPIPEQQSTKPLAYDQPGTMIPGGTKPGVSYGASHSLLCINHIPIENHKILIRVEFNEPTKNNLVTNNYRMRMTIPTIKYALKWRARAVIVLAHFRDPQGRRDPDLSLKPICDEMATLLGETVVFVPRTVGKDVMTTINQVHAGSVLMVENVRFHPEEEQPFLHTPDGRFRPVKSLQNPSQILPSGYASEVNAQFCEELSRLGDIYVNDAFGGLHLDHASITGNFRPTRVCGFLVKNELKYLAKLLNYPNRKFVVILGGTDMEEKMDLLPGILKEADSVILAGTMACLFLKVQHGLKTGKMAFTFRLEERAREMTKLAGYYKCRIHYPVDLAVSPEPQGDTLKQVSISEGIPKGHVFVDIGNLSASMFTRIIKRKHMIFWMGTTGNGMLSYERSATKQLMEAMYQVTHDPEKSAVTIVGGRSLSQIVEQYDPEHESFTHLTTGGRVALQLLAHRHVVGLDCLLPKPGKRPMSIMGAADYTEFRDAKVLIRCDLDIPLKDGVPVNTFPLQHLVETIRMIQKKGAQAILLVSQLGEPDGEEKEEMSLEPIKDILETALEQPVEWTPGGIDSEVESAMTSAERGAVILAENICFYPEESGFKTTPAGTRVPVSHEDMAMFRQRLTGIADVFVNESFATLHRAYSSVVGITRRPCLAGASLKKQVYDYVDIRRQLDGSFLLILGSEDVEDIFSNLLLLYNALDIVDNVFLCGNMALVFKSSAANSGVKQFKDAQLIIPRIVRKARLRKVTLAQVSDAYAARDPSNPDEEPRVVQLDVNSPRGYTRCDMGPTSVNALTNAIRAAKLIVLCGTTGKMDHDHHCRGTKGILDQIAAVTSDGSATAVALGRATGQFIYHFGHVDTFVNYSVQAEPFFDIMMRRPLPGLETMDRMPPNPLRKLSIEQINLSGKRVLLRTDLDVPSVEGVVLDTDKLEDAAATITYALSHGAKCVVLMGHRGEPGGYKNFYLRMEPLVVEISAILGTDVAFIDRPCSKKAKALLEDPPTGSVFLMENLKFYPAESGVDAEPRKVRSSKKGGEASLTEVSELPKDETQGDSASINILPTDGDNTGQTTPVNEPTEPETEAEDDVSVSGEELSVSDGEGGLSVDSLMFQLMRAKTVQQFTLDLAACGDVFINDDVAHVEEPLTSYSGLGLPERGCGLMLAEFLRDSEEMSVYQLPGVESLSNAPPGQ